MEHGVSLAQIRVTRALGVYQLICQVCKRGTHETACHRWSSIKSRRDRERERERERKRGIALFAGGCRRCCCKCDAPIQRVNVSKFSGHRVGSTVDVAVTFRFVINTLLQASLRNSRLFLSRRGSIIVSLQLAFAANLGETFIALSALCLLTAAASRVSQPSYHLR